MARKPKQPNQSGTMIKLTREEHRKQRKFLLHCAGKSADLPDGRAIVKADHGYIVVDSGIYEERIPTRNQSIALESNDLEYDLSKIESEVSRHVDSKNSYLADDARECLRSLALLRKTIGAIDDNATCRQVVPLAGPVRLPRFEVLIRLALGVGKLRERVFVRQRESVGIKAKRSKVGAKKAAAFHSRKAKLERPDFQRLVDDEVQRQINAGEPPRFKNAVNAVAEAGHGSARDIERHVDNRWTARRKRG